jgi:hypothetical protein
MGIINFAGVKTDMRIYTLLYLPKKIKITKNLNTTKENLLYGGDTLELPRGTTTKYYEKENFSVNSGILDDIENDFVGYVRIFGKNDTVEDNYLLINGGRVIAAESEIGGSEIFRGDESLVLMKERVYDHAAIEFVEYDEFRYQMALEINEDCCLEGKTVPKSEIEKKMKMKEIVEGVSSDKNKREELLKKYRIRVPSEETIIQLIGEKDETITKLENELKSELLNEIKEFLYGQTLFMDVSFTGFEMFSRGDILNCTIGIFLKCHVYKKDAQVVGKGFEGEIKKIVGNELKKKIGNAYKINATVDHKYKIRETSRGIVEDYVAKSMIQA